jgi:hypothetical protein
MSELPLQTTPTYELKLPSTGATVKYRPFIVKEEKVLLMASQEGDERHTLEAIRQIIDACTFKKLNVPKLATADVEYLFIALRNKSLGEGLDIQATCGACGAKNIVQCNLDDVKVERKKDMSNIITLGDNLKVSMRYPTLEMSYDLSDDDLNKTIELIAKCTEFVEYNGKLIECDTLPIAETIQFVEHLTQGQLKELNSYFESIPKTVFRDEFVCTKCAEKNTITIEGISNFFA